MKFAVFISLLFVSLAHTINGYAADNASTPLSLDDARHLITRTGLGASPAELNRFIGLAPTDAVNKIIAGLSEQPNLPFASVLCQSATNRNFARFAMARCSL